MNNLEFRTQNPEAFSDDYAEYLELCAAVAALESDPVQYLRANLDKWQMEAEAEEVERMFPATPVPGMTVPYEPEYVYVDSNCPIYE